MAKIKDAENPLVKAAQEKLKAKSKPEVESEDKEDLEDKMESKEPLAKLFHALACLLED